MKQFVLFIFCLFLSAHADAQLTIFPSQTAIQLARQLAGTGVVISNISYTGNDSSSGSFTCLTGCNLGFSDGILLTSGWANNSLPPNNSSGITGAVGTPGDTDLMSVLPSGTSTYDASVLEFDFIAVSDSVRFNYFFASEEYNDYVNTINDAFAFFISGPSIIGKKNLALIPGTTLPVAINNVNNGYSIFPALATGPCTNCNYFIDNSANTISTQYDGLTTNFEAVSACIPGLTYHLKLVIADAFDYVLDSGVFLETESFKSSDTVKILIGSQDVNNDTVNVCQGDSVLLSVPAGFHYLWSTGDTTNTIYVSTAGIFSVQIFDSAMTWVIQTDSVLFNVMSGTPPTIIYNNGQLISSITNPSFQYSWVLNGNQLVGQTNPFLIPTQQGCYALIVLNSLGCSGISNTECVTSLTGIANTISTNNNYIIETNGSQVAIDFQTKTTIKKLIRLSDLQGRILKEIYSAENKIEFSVPFISKGIYFISVNDDNGAFAKTRKIFLNVN